MDPIHFLWFARDVERVRLQEDGTYLLYEDYDEDEPIYQSRRIPELERKFGPNAMAFESTPLEYDHVMYDVYSLTESGDEISLEFMLQVVYNHVTVYAFHRLENLDWVNVKVNEFEREKQLVLDYLCELPRFRLAFVTGAMKIEEYE